jgi:RimJ/RimL family protein N-acetyltransferase
MLIPVCAFLIGLARGLLSAAMRREGHLRQSAWAKGGWTGDLLYALLREEWQTRPG